MTQSLWYSLRNLVALRQFEAAGALLKTSPELPRLRNRAGETVLHFMAVENDLIAVRWLHAQGFDLNTVNDFGQPVVFEVAQLGHESMLLWFARVGANLAATDADGHDIVTFLREVLHGEMLDFLHEHHAALGLPVAAFGVGWAALRPRPAVTA